MSIIEQAARRLEELKRAGVVLPAEVASNQVAGGAAGSATTPGQAAITQLYGSAPQPQAAPGLPPPAVDPLSLGAAAARAALAPAPVRLSSPVPAAAVPPNRPVEPRRRSREVRIDLDRLSTAGYLVPGQTRTQLAEQMRLLKRPLVANARGEGAEPVARANLIQVVSALPGEGKTFVAMNLAMSIAMEVDHSVLLVDADVLHPAVLKRYGLDATAGLMDVLHDPEMDLADVLLRTNVPKLSLLPAGRASSESTEHLASLGMERLLDELAAKYADRIIVFDAPPLIPTTESRVLASRMGQVLMVVEAEATTRPQLAQAYAALEGCPVVYSILNKAPQVHGDGYGYYGAPVK
ncbi:MAG: hypothetical protein RL722_452 [Pseudomonadota bacterium]|jgi:receptor protein-tyrosine kinase